MRSDAAERRLRRHWGRGSNVGLLAVGLVLFVPMASQASELQRRVVKPVAFLPGSRLVYRALDLACHCQGQRCLYVDEAGETPCTPEEVVIQDLATDARAPFDRKQAAALAVESPPPRQTFPLELGGDVFTVELAADCNPPQAPEGRGSSIWTCRVFLVSRRHGRKPIGAFQISWSPAHRISVLGYYRNGSEPRIAVLIDHRGTQFEESTTSSESLLGADLSRWKGAGDAGTH
jgi:hypothetical protein